MAGRWDIVNIDGSEMRCYVGVPDGQGPLPAVIVIQHAGGVDEFVQTMTDRFAEAGFVAISPDLYHRQDPDSGEDPLTRMGHLRDDEIARDVKAAFERLKAMPEASDSVGITGFCMGGRVAYLMATHIPELKAAVVFYGGNILVPWGDGPAPLDRTEHIQCPLLGLFGEDDTNPSPADVARIDAELTRLGKEHELHMYQGAGHAFMHYARPSHRPETAADAWEKCIGWFRRYLPE